MVYVFVIFKSVRLTVMGSVCCVSDNDGIVLTVSVIVMGIMHYDQW